jgi:hypothetical protein
MKISRTQIWSGLAIGFGLLSLFSIWNIYNWALLGWGSKLFLFPFLAVISFMAKLSVQKRILFEQIQGVLLLLQIALYFFVFNLQDPHHPNLLLLLIPMLLSTTILILAKKEQLKAPNAPQSLVKTSKQVSFLLYISCLFYVLMGVLKHQAFLLPGIAFEILGMVFYFVLLLKYPQKFNS